jgi:hypothetical protein
MEKYFLFGWATAMLDKLRNLTRSEAIPYVCSFSVSPSFRLPEDFPFKKYPGLRFCHIISESSGCSDADDSDGVVIGDRCRLSAYWQDKKHYTMHGPKFCADAGLSAPRSDAALVGLFAPSEHILKRFDLKDWIVVLSGVLAATTILHTWFAGIIEAPDVKVAFADVTPINATPPDGITLTLNVINESAAALATIRKIDAKAQPVGGNLPIMLQPDLPAFPLAAGQNTPIRITGSVIEPKDASGKVNRNHPPEEYKVSVSVHAHTGAIRKEGESGPPNTRSIFVWPAGVGWREPEEITKESSDDSRRLLVRLYPGQAYANGVNGFVSVRSKPQEVARLILEGLDLTTKSGEPSTPDSHGDVTQVVHFQTSALKRFDPFLFALRLDTAVVPSPNGGPGLPAKITPERWKQIIHWIHVFAE